MTADQSRHRHTRICASLQQNWCPWLINRRPSTPHPVVGTTAGHSMNKTRVKHKVWLLSVANPLVLKLDTTVTKTHTGAHTWAGLMTWDTRESECQVGQQINIDTSVLVSVCLFLRLFFKPNTWWLEMMNYKENCKNVTCSWGWLIQLLSKNPINQKYYILPSAEFCYSPTLEKITSAEWLQSCKGRLSRKTTDSDTCQRYF